LTKLANQSSRYIPAEKHELVALGEMQRDGVKSIQPYILGVLSLDHLFLDLWYKQENVRRCVMKISRKKHLTSNIAIINAPERKIFFSKNAPERKMSIQED